MHELSVIIHIADVIDDFAKQNKIRKISAVTLQIGEVSGILYDYFQDCWDYFRRKKPILENAELKVEIIPAINYCTACKREYPVIPNGRICPYCGSPDTYIVQGNETIIKEIEVADDPPLEENDINSPPKSG